MEVVGKKNDLVVDLILDSGVLYSNHQISLIQMFHYILVMFHYILVMFQFLPSQVKMKIWEHPVGVLRLPLLQ